MEEVPGKMSKKAVPYAVAIAIQAIYTGIFVVSKAAFDATGAINTFVFMFYRLAAASALLLPIALLYSSRSPSPSSSPTMTPRLLCKLFLHALLGNTFTLNVYNASLKHTSATVASAAINSMPVFTFLIAVLMGMEKVGKIRSRSAAGKLAGVALCVAGVLVIALYAGPTALRPLTGRPVLFHNASAGAKAAAASHGAVWIRATFLIILATATWSLSIVLQVPLLKEYPNKLMATAMQCFFGAIQSFVVAVVVERDFYKWKLGFDIGLLAILYSAFLGTGAVMYLQAWCAEMKGAVFVAMWNPMALIFTIFCSSFFLGESVHLGSILGGILLVGGLYSVLWGKSKEKENKIAPATPEEIQEGTTMQEKDEEEELTSQV
ncbi:hypothetical protein BRADI_4g12094v3 [Brachypodium distachyon]|uniref:WAT1-related protein n=1 Tax=Brachypodium distachyon TaxID=15368 RepID=A0A0Q3EMS0_BRADI|nr:hypothetical protein BRADI_4g12094v3 [Brachypodium distachyon]